MSFFNFHWISEIFGDKKNLTIFDVGAFDFQDSIKFKRAFPNSSVYAFEAFTYNCEKYGNRAIDNGIKIFNLAIAEKKGTVKFYNSTDINGSEWTCSGSILFPSDKVGIEIHRGLNFNKEGILVDSVRLDDFCKENLINTIDVIHMDVQGAEYYALKGLGKLRPEIIFCETCEYETYENSLTLKDLDDLLYSMGYKVKERLQYDTVYVLN